MKSIIEKLGMLNSSSLSFFDLSVGFLCMVLLSFILKAVYRRHQKNCDLNLDENIFLALASATFLVVVVIQDSLTLSLGMVGALSIVRFRTPIKNPFELIYLFISIGLGVAFGSGQALIAVLISALVLSTLAYIATNKLRVNLLSNANIILKVVYESDETLKKLMNFASFDYIDLTPTEILLEKRDAKDGELLELLRFCESNHITVISSSLQK
jgi:hypothetical protein